MCRVLTFHHFCGHIHSTRTLTCLSPTPFTSPPPACHAPPAPSPDSKSLSPSPPCTKTTHEPLLYPTLCKTCEEIGVISDYFKKTPGTRIDAVMEWRKKDGKDVGENSEEMPFLTLKDLQALSSSSRERSRSDSKASTATTTILQMDAQCSPSFTSPSYSTKNTSTTPQSTTPTSPRKTPTPTSPKDDNASSVHNPLSSSTTTKGPMSENFQRTRTLVARMAALNTKMKSRFPSTNTASPSTIAIGTATKSSTGTTSGGAGEGVEEKQSPNQPLSSPDAADGESTATATATATATLTAMEVGSSLPSSRIKPVRTSTIKRRGAVSGPSGLLNPTQE